MTLIDFKALLRRYLDGQASEAELRLIDRWYDSLNEEVAYQFTPAEQTRLKARMWERINEEITIEEGQQTTVLPLPVPRRTVWWRQGSWQAAAILLMILAGAGVGWLTTRSSSGLVSGSPAFKGELARLSAGFTERQNTTDKAITLRLPDGSTVYLTPRSALRMAPSRQQGERIVYLVGDAFFTITKDPHRPFRVITEQVETQVLGTSFWVHAANRTNKVAVEVSTGKVQVYERTQETKARNASAKASRGVVLTPNQMVTITNSEHWQTGLIAQPVPIRPEATSVAAEPTRPDRLAFTDASLPAVCQQLTKVYGIDIDLASPDLAGCTFSGDIANQPLYTQLDLLCAAINARYDIRGTHILISGRGCPR